MCCRFCVKYRNVWLGLTDGTGEKKVVVGELLIALEKSLFYVIRELEVW